MPKLMSLLDLIEEVEGDPDKLKSIRQQLVDRFNAALARIDEAEVKQQAVAGDDEPTAMPDEGCDEPTSDRATNDEACGVQVVANDDAFVEVHVTHFHIHV
jgi:hypothetical protein